MTGSRARTARAMVLRTLRERRRDTAWLALWSAAEALPALVFGRAVAGAIDAFRAGAVPAGLGWLGVLLAAALAGAAASRQSFGRLAAIVEPLRDRLVTAVVTAAVRRSADAVRGADTGAVARITHQAEIVRDSFGGLLMTLRTAAFTAGAALIGLATLAPPVALLAAGPMLASLALFAWLMRALADRQRRYVLSEEAVAAAVAVAGSSLRDITACGGEAHVAGQTGSLVAAQARAGRSLAGLTACRTLVLAVGCWLPVLLVIGTAPWLLRHGVTPGGVIGALAYLTGGLQLALSTLVQGTGSAGVRMAVTMERMLTGTGDEAPPGGPAAARPAGAPARPTAAAAGRAPGADPAGPPRLPAGTTVRLRGVTFAYGRHADPVIRDLTLDIPYGDHLAVVGPSGIGKSTLAGLMTGMLRPDRGQVLLGGVPAGEADPAELASRRVLIPQEAYVFTGTVRDNLAYLSPAARTADLAAAVAAVGAAGLVSRCGGYGAWLDPGSLSDGERQLFALARAYLSAARLVVLDEATCHLDPAAEARAETAFAQRPGTLVVIAHRATSALRARRVLVLDGTSAQVGGHWSLLAESALYADLIGHWDTPASGPAGPDAALAPETAR
ncbi:MAG: ATP-binding cassette domain-containing protein [Gemmatimonadota bacterium]